jgi:hypothetical protein
VYRIEPYSLDELEAAAARLATRVAGHNEDSKSHILRGKAAATSFSARRLSRACLSPLRRDRGQGRPGANGTPDRRESGQESSDGSFGRDGQAVGLDIIGSSGENLAFERLWQIKAAGMNRVRGRWQTCLI